MSTSYDKIKIEAGAWVVVCDGRKALILCNKGDATFPNLRTHEVHEQDNPPTGAQGTDAPGRVHQSASPARSSVEPTDWHDEAERDFLRELAGKLDAAVAKGEVKSLVIVAAPRALGVLRPFYSPALKEAIGAEVDRDMVKLPVYEIEKHLAA
ncbi:host attachment family protein [Ancylobacter mangrovi]|uniref:Host attachment family protein n=1 Tax=Ancylobacter mangrovi TaxID=2972472 RepID=A0A9X2PFF0_9HYPH|nr:host attachment family protein [Ancylobacter mangrovi]MCS0495198.1 host attachment family protein [Ancylobacter mangrovi]MCS0502593.1 host attachment family protein [Ancylobacter mangrovi]